MDDAAADCGAFFETTAFLNHFNDLPEQRQPGKVSYPPDAVLAGAETFVDIARFGDKKLDLLRRFRPFRDARRRTITWAISSLL